ncbi:unnamed protein product [Symbiodinium necroappetens]|uniref:Uncharacterized protein n=1 Tax=Symbiodinium necroappetens TaxID=1628268 RepID=A0A812MCI6_9DINO|nr:unnamed protein product [Symbiodinium necroappetens]
MRSTGSRNLESCWPSKWKVEATWFAAKVLQASQAKALSLWPRRAKRLLGRRRNL